MVEWLTFSPLLASCRFARARSSSWSALFSRTSCPVLLLLAFFSSFARWSFSLLRFAICVSLTCSCDCNAVTCQRFINYYADYNYTDSPDLLIFLSVPCLVPMLSSICFALLVPDRILFLVVSFLGSMINTDQFLWHVQISKTVLTVDLYFCFKASRSWWSSVSLDCRNCSRGTCGRGGTGWGSGVAAELICSGGCGSVVRLHSAFCTSESCSIFILLKYCFFSYDL